MGILIPISSLQLTDFYDKLNSKLEFLREMFCSNGI